MPNVTEHDTEQEGERGDRKQSRVNLLISCNPICVHDRLERPGKLVGTMVRRRSFRSRDLMQNGGYCRSGCLLQSISLSDLMLNMNVRFAVAYRGATESNLDLADISTGNPTLRKQRLLAWVILEQVER